MLIPSKLQFPVSGDHFGIPPGVGIPIVVRVMLDPVNLQYHASSARQQQEEVHALPQQGRTGPARVRVVMEVYLRDQCWLIEPDGAVALAELREQELLGGVAVHRGPQALIELPPRFKLGHPGLGVRPHRPFDQRPPGQTSVRERLVVHQAVLSVLHDLDGVVDRVLQHDLRLWTVGGEDQVFQLAVDAAITG